MFIVDIRFLFSSFNHFFYRIPVIIIIIIIIIITVMADFGHCDEQSYALQSLTQ
jgi:hypothetical protein